MTVATDARVSSLDRMLNDRQVGDSFATDMFAVVDALEASPTLRRAVTDPGTPESARRALVHGLLDGKVDKAVVDLVGEAATLRWAGGRTFAAALERQAVRGQLVAADRRGELEDAEDQLFRFGRFVSITCCPSSAWPTSVTCPAKGFSGCPNSPGWSRCSPAAPRCRNG